MPEQVAVLVPERPLIAGREIFRAFRADDGGPVGTGAPCRSRNFYRAAIPLSSRNETGPPLEEQPTIEYVLGQRMRTVMKGRKATGIHGQEWEGKTASGR